MHLDGILDRLQNLFAQRCGAAIPEKRIFPREIFQCHRIARADVTVHAAAEASWLRKRQTRIVASRAGLRIVRRKPPVEKQTAAERNAFAGERIVERQIRLRRELRNRQPIRRGVWRDLDVICSARQLGNR